MTGSRLTPPILAALLSLSAAVAQSPDRRTPPQSPEPRLHTDRAGKHLLTLPKEDDAFGFTIFGDRTGGPAAGIAILAQAVTDTNLLDPDLVMTVGDLVQGYNDTERWLPQMREFKATMAELRMPWFPVAGNHDIYWRGEGRPEREHEGDYETHFGPLWYAFEHKRCWFIALFSDEGNPETGQKSFNDPAAQRMSPEQFAWLRGILQKAKAARHVFVFLHHPRWLQRYGDDWQKVHEALAAAGNVRAVFAGHIHRMRYDGVRDGIEYFALATTGGSLGHDIPQAGYLHHFHAVTVRPEGIAVATLPVGTVLDPRTITGEVSDDVAALISDLRPSKLRGAAFAADGSVEGLVQLDLENPARRPIEVTLLPRGGPRWSFRPDHTHSVIAPGASITVAFLFERTRSAPSDVDLPRLSIACDYLGPATRIALPEREHELALSPPASLGTRALGPGRPAEAGSSIAGNHLVVDGRGDCLQLPSDALAVPDGPLTLEAWFRADDFAGRRGLCAKTEDSEFGLFISDGKPVFSIHLAGRYVDVRTDDPVLEVGRWHHLAGVFDGAEVRLYLDGELRARAPGKGPRTPNRLPLYVGADADSNGRPVSFFTGCIDEVRLSSCARYAGASFQPPRRYRPDDDTQLLLHLDAEFGPWTPDASGHGRHPRRRGDAAVAR